MLGISVELPYLAALGVILAGILFFRMSSTENRIEISLLENCKWKGKHFAVICNQFGGKRNGRVIVDTIVRPLCEANGVSVDVMYTEHHKHAAEMAARIDLKKYDGIIIVSGDGLIHEFLNGLATKTNSSDDFIELLKTLPPIGVVPGGTCNGLATSITSSDPHNAMCKILQGSRQMIDVYHVESVDSEVPAPMNVWDVHGCAWALLSEADEVLGKIRWIPHILREPLAAAYLIAKKRVYCGTLYLKPFDMDATIRKLNDYGDYEVLPLVSDGPYAGHRVINGQFLMFAAMNTHYASFDMKLTPRANATDGCVDIMLMRGESSRWDALHAFLCMEDGAHARHPRVELYKVTSFTLIRTEGNINVSGEIYPSDDVTITPVNKAVPFIF